MPHVEIADVLAREFVALHGQRAYLIRSEEEYRARVHALAQANPQHPLSALCLSGGGIRSASFALGVLQALARHGLLEKFHYLSTVSGGGYIGAWLQTWRQQVKLGRLLVRLGARDPDGKEPDEITGLRADSSYLTPKRGITSADTWAGIVLYLRNLILNWLVLGPLFLALLTSPWLGFDLTRLLAGAGPESCHPPTTCHPLWRFALMTALGSASLVFGLHSAAWQRRFAPHRYGQGHFLFAVLLPVVIAACFITLAAATQNGVPKWAAPLWGAGIYLLAWSTAWVRAGCPSLQAIWPTPEEPVPPALELVIWLVCGLLAGFLILVIFHFAGGTPLELHAPRTGSGSMLVAYRQDGELTTALPGADAISRLVVLGSGLFMLAVGAGEILYVGLSSYSNHGDHDREWLARSAGWLFAATLAWLVLSAIALYAGRLAEQREVFLSIAVTIATGSATALGGKSPLSPALQAMAGLSSKTRSGKSLPKQWLLPAAALVFLLALAVLLAVFNQWLLAAGLPGLFGLAVGPDWPGHAAGLEVTWLAFMLIVGLFASLWVNVNRFSMHGTYRNRLVRAFLGSARAGVRNPDPFTGFDERDNRPMADLWPAGPEGEPRLFPVVNVTLNLVDSRNPAWQERKAESFVITPLHCGNPRVHFRPTHDYGGMRNGISVGTAMAISGAAVSPNMGYHSSPLVGFVMTLLNVRLGAWLGSPSASDAVARSDGPYFGAGAILRELLGLTTETAKYIYLSDGGHFENLGIYEMLRRRCRFILVSDAGEDHACHFEDLGNALRKAFIDFGIQVEFDDLAIEARADPPKPGVDCAIATIHYPDENAPTGTLIYLKPGFHGTEAPDIRSYAAAHAEFPHESTVNQFFTESQMEAYRALGANLIGHLCGEDPPPATLDQFRRRVEAFLKRDRAPAAPAAARHFAQGGAPRRKRLLA